MMNMNMGINLGMNNMNQIYMQINQLMIQIMNNINIVLTNMNQLMTNMNQMNKLINEITNNQINNNNINSFNNMINFNPMNFNSPIQYDFSIWFQYKSEKTLIHCNSKDKLSDVIKKYELKTNSKGIRKYIYNSIVLKIDDDVTVENSRIINGGRIDVITIDQLKGG
mgnify:CR=1 FL=1